ncbi:lipase family protein [Mycolicibacterium sp. XJ870]
MVRVLALLSVVLAVITGCGGGSSEEPEAWKSEDAGAVIAEAPLSDLDPALREAASDARTMTYVSRNGVNDAVAHVAGSVFVPKGTAPPGGFPIVALGHRTVGTAPDCAPSVSPNLFGESATVVALLNAGYVVTVPDYQGLGKPAKPDEYDFHPYLDSTTAGYNMIDAVRATRAMVPNTSTSWAALGAQEGGQAAWAANELVENYGSGLDLVVTASLAPMAEIEGLVDAAMAGSLNPDQKVVYTRYLEALKNQYYYDLELDDYRRGAAQDNWDALLSCQNSAERTSLAAQIPPEDLRPAGPEALEVLRGFIQKTNLPQGPTQVPMYVIYGGQDSVIPAAWTDRALTRACQMGDVIQIAFWPDKPRDQIDPTAALGWLKDRLNSIPSANDCEAFMAAHK